MSYRVAKDPGLFDEGSGNADAAWAIATEGHRQLACGPDAEFEENAASVPSPRAQSNLTEYQFDSEI